MFFGRDKGRHALNFQQAGFERAAQEYEQAARDQVHVCSCTCQEQMPREGVRENMCALENQAEQTWTSHQMILLNEMTSVAGDVLEKPEEVCSLKQRQNFKGIKGKVMSTKHE